MTDDRKRVAICSRNRGFILALGALFEDADLHFGEAPAQRDLPADVLIWHVEGEVPTRELAPIAASTPTLVVGEDDQLLEAVDAGVRGFLPKESSLNQVRAAALTIVGGGSVVPPELLGTLLRHIVDQRRDAVDAKQQLRDLTERELQVFELAAAGARKEEIGRRLFISPGTARTHLQRVYRKLGIHSQAELIALGSKMRGRTEEKDSAID